MGRLTGEVAIITGAASGIGRAALELFLAEGARVIGADRSQKRIDETVASLTGQSADFALLAADAAEEAAVQGLVNDAIARFGRPDIVFANAGIGGSIGTVDTLELAQFTETLRVNLLGPWLLIKHAAPHLRAQKSGSVIITASIAGLRGRSGPVDYSASKAGVLSLMQSAALSLARDNVRCNAICPGGVQTNMTRRVFEMLEAANGKNPIAAMNPMGRVGSAQDMAELALFLASDAAGYINGQAINVDGGLSASHPWAPEVPYL